MKNYNVTVTQTMVTRTIYNIEADNAEDARVTYDKGKIINVEDQDKTDYFVTEVDEESGW